MQMLGATVQPCVACSMGNNRVVMRPWQGVPNAKQASRRTPARICDVTPDGKLRQVAANVLSPARTTNPAFTFGNIEEARRESPSSREGYMTMNGAIGKTALLLLVTLAGAAYTWNGFFQGMAAAAANPHMARGALVGLAHGLQQTSMNTGIVAFVISLAISFKPNWADKLAPLYAAFKGAFLGAFSAYLEMRYPGLVMNAVMLTMCVSGALLGAYKANLIDVTDRMRSMFALGLGGVFMLYIGQALLRLVGVNMRFLHSGPMGLAVTGVVALMAAGSMLMDFDMLERMERSNYPRWMEWYGGFAVLVSFVWLYFEFAKLLSIFGGMSRND